MDRESVKLSVIIPMYNAEKFIAPCLDSIIGQQLEGCEIIVVDDGSTDGSGKIADCYASKYDTIKVFHIPNGGVSNARNIGLSIVSGEYIHFMDSDDILHKNMYYDFYNAVQAYPYDLLIGGYYKCDAYGTVLEEKRSSSEIIGKRLEDIQSFLNNVTIDNKDWLLNVLWNKWFKREIIEKVNLRFRADVSFGEDFIFICKYYKHLATFIVLNKSYYYYYLHGTGLVSKFHADILTRRPLVYECYKALYKCFNIYDENKGRLQLYEGSFMYSEILAMSTVRNNLKKRDKKQILNKIINSKHYELVLKYLAEQKSVFVKVIYYIFKTKNVVLVFAFTRFFARMIRLKKVFSGDKKSK